MHAFVVKLCISFESNMNLTPNCNQHLTNPNKAGELEKSVILLVTAGHGVHLFNILFHHNSCLDVIQSFLTHVACWIVAAKKKEKQMCDMNLMQDRSLKRFKLNHLRTPDNLNLSYRFIYTLI